MNSLTHITQTTILKHLHSVAVRVVMTNDHSRSEAVVEQIITAKRSHVSHVLPAASFHDGGISTALRHVFSR